MANMLVATSASRKDVSSHFGGLSTRCTRSATSALDERLEWYSTCQVAHSDVGILQEGTASKVSVKRRCARHFVANGALVRAVGCVSCTAQPR